MVTTKLNLSMTEPSVRQIYAKQGDTGRVLDITLDQTPEDGTLRILRPDGTEVTSEAVTGGEVESGDTFESLTEADVTELTVGIEPVQDLNGYDKPWVGGAGKNLLPYPYYENTKTVNGITFTVKADGTIVANGTATSNAIFLFQSADWTISENYILNGCPSGGSGTTFSLQVQNTGGTTLYDYGSGVTLPSATYHSILFIVRSGYTANNLTAKPMLRKATVSDPTWQPYSNICPITGRTGVTVYRTGKNLADISNAANATNVVDSVDADGKIHFKDVTARWSMPYIGKMFVKAGETYTLSGGIAYGRIGLSTNTRYPQAGVNIPDITILGGGSASSFLTKDRTVNSFTANYTGYMYAFYCSDMHYAEAHGEFSCYVFCNVGSSATSYEPYNGNTYTSDWTSPAGTVYGGTLDVVTGVLTVDRAMVDLGTLNWAMSGSGNTAFFYANTSALGVASDIATTPNYICENYSRVPVSSGGTGTGMAFTSASQLRIRDATYSDAAFFKTAMDGVQLVYELDTPVEYQLTPQQVKTLIGTNNVWASSGDIVNIKFTYGGLLSELPSDATEIVGKCYCDVEQNGVSSMPFTLNVKKNERES